MEVCADGQYPRRCCYQPDQEVVTCKQFLIVVIMKIEVQKCQENPLKLYKQIFDKNDVSKACTVSLGQNHQKIIWIGGLYCSLDIY